MVSDPDSAGRVADPAAARAAPSGRPPPGARRWLRDPRLHRLIIGLVICALVIWVRWHWDQLTAAHVPYVDYDTQIFEQIAQQPASVALLFAPKPLVVPLVYRLASNDHAAIVAVQESLAFVSWAGLAASLALALRRRWARALALVVCAAFLLAPTRVGFSGSLLSESINDSLTTFVVAGAISLLWARGRARRVAVAATAVLGLAWLFTRDTNAVILLVAAGTAMLVWRGWRQRWAWIAALVAVVSAAFVLWTASVPHAPLAYQSNWYERFTPRAVYPMVDNLAMRVYPDQPDALPSGLRTFAAPGTAWLNVEQIVRAGAEHRAAQDWAVDHGSATYAHWLLRHPLDRLTELLGIHAMVLSSARTAYMPKHWVSHGNVLRQLTQKHAFLLVLLVAAPALLWRPRAAPLRGLALCLLASGLFGIAAAYYGDAAEVSRHCYGPGQQVVLALFLAVLARLDRRL